LRRSALCVVVDDLVVATREALDAQICSRRPECFGPARVTRRALLQVLQTRVLTDYR
jgi:hypothetical protein